MSSTEITQLKFVINKASGQVWLYMYISMICDLTEKADV